MYYLTYQYNNCINVGFLNDEKNGVIPALDIFTKLNLKVPENMIELIEIISASDYNELKETVNLCSKNFINIKDIKIMAPIPYPKRNVICLGKNYRDHINEMKGISNIDVNKDVPAKPIYFSKIAYPAIGYGDFIDSHSEFVKELDYEVELAIVIGKKCKNVKKENAEDCIFGYTIANDISARDIQFSHIQWHKGKSLDTFCPMGPYIADKNIIAFPPALEITSLINGEQRQKNNTENLIFDIPAIINDITSGITLYPGDIILTGTPSGVGAGFKPPKFLKPGDTIECKIENIGTLINTVK